MTHGPSQLAAVAAVFRTAASLGKPPQRAVEETFGVSRATAGRMIRDARAIGVLAPTRRGNRSMANPKVVRVAKALGVDPEDLHRAVLRHADGDLRVRPG